MRRRTTTAEEDWRDLRAYADSLRREKDEDGAPKFHFPDDYDEVVRLMGRRDLDDDKTWSAVALRGGVGESCGRRYGWVDEADDKVLAGLAKIQQLDRKLRSLRPKDDDASSVISSERAFVTQRLAPRRPPVDPPEELPPYGPTEEEARRLREIDDKLRTMGFEDLCLGAGTPAAEDVLLETRRDREDRAHELDVDRRLAMARDAPLVILDDDEVETFEATAEDGPSKLLPPPCASDVRALVAKLLKEQPPMTDEEKARVRQRVDALADSMRIKIATVATVRDERRRRRRRASTTTRVPPASLRDDDDDDDDGQCLDAPPPAAPPCLAARPPRPDEPFAADISDALLEVALKTSSTLNQASAKLRRATSVATQDYLLL